MKRSAPMRRRRRIRAKKAKRVLNRTPGETAYTLAVRKMHCVSCGKRGPSDPAHVKTGPGQGGMALKVSEYQQVPLCFDCHGYWDGRLEGAEDPFEGMDREERYAQGRKWVKETHDMLMPAETFSAAFSCAEQGLGRIIRSETGEGWRFIPVWDDNEQEPT